MKIILILILILFSTITAASERKWTTIEHLPNNDKIKFFWVGAYKGYDAIYRLEIIRNEGLVKSIRIHGQPLLNTTKKYLAVKNCWHGGCQRDIRVFELTNYNELTPISTDKESLIGLHWQDAVLTIELSGTKINEMPVSMSIPVTGRDIFIRSPSQGTPEQ